ncbi:hypothetical protein V8E52_005840 [Russula decolorans]
MSAILDTVNQNEAVALSLRQALVAPRSTTPNSALLFELAPIQKKEQIYTDQNGETVTLNQHNTSTIPVHQLARLAGGFFLRPSRPAVTKSVKTFKEYGRFPGRSGPVPRCCADGVAPHLARATPGQAEGQCNSLENENPDQGQRVPVGGDVDGDIRRERKERVLRGGGSMGMWNLTIKRSSFDLATAVRVGSDDEMVEGVYSTQGWMVYELQLRTENKEGGILIIHQPLGSFGEQIICTIGSQSSTGLNESIWGRAKIRLENRLTYRPGEKRRRGDEGEKESGRTREASNSCNKWETEDGDDYVGMEGGGGGEGTKEYLVRVRSVPLWCKRLRGGEAEEKEGSRGFVVTSATAREWEKILGLSVQLKFERWIELECLLRSTQIVRPTGNGDWKPRQLVVLINDFPNLSSITITTTENVGRLGTDLRCKLQNYKQNYLRRRVLEARTRTIPCHLPAAFKLNADVDVDDGRRRRWQRALARGNTLASTVFADVIFRAIMRGTCVTYAERVVLALGPHHSTPALRPIFHFCQVYTWNSDTTATTILFDCAAHFWSYGFGILAESAPLEGSSPPKTVGTHPGLLPTTTPLSSSSLRRQPPPNAVFASSVVGQPTAQSVVDNHPLPLANIPEAFGGPIPTGLNTHHDHPP